MEWSVNIDRRTATSDRGIVVKFLRVNDQEWTGRILDGRDSLEDLSPESAARLLREAGDAFSFTLRNQPIDSSIGLLGESE